VNPKSIFSSFEWLCVRLREFKLYSISPSSLSYMGIPSSNSPEVKKSFSISLPYFSVVVSGTIRLARLSFGST
jgi:hypothetical protein